MSAKNRSFLSGFRYALDGVRDALKSERSLRIHFVMAALVTACGVAFGISAREWITCIVLFGLVIGAELMNTALETAVDMISPDPDPRAKRVKDIAAAAVLVVSAASAIAGLIIFVPRIWNLIF